MVTTNHHIENQKVSSLDFQLIGFCSLLAEALDDLTMKILIAAAAVSLLINWYTEGKDGHSSTYWVEPLAIFIAVAVCSLVAAVNDYQKEKQFQALNKVADDKKNV